MESREVRHHALRDGVCKQIGKGRATQEKRKGKRSKDNFKFSGEPVFELEKVERIRKLNLRCGERKTKLTEKKAQAEAHALLLTCHQRQCRNEECQRHLQPSPEQQQARQIANPCS